MSSKLKIIIIVGALLYLVPLGLIYVFQRSLLYFPPQTYLTPQTVNLALAAEVVIESDTGDKLTAWWMPPKNKNLPVILFFHGNGSAVFSNHDVYRDLSGAGYGVLGVGYPGYPGSSGRPTQKALVASAQAHYAWLAESGISAERIVFYGTSLGSGVAAQLAANQEPVLIILEAPFNAAADIGQQSMPIFPVKLLMKDPYDSASALRRVKAPILWLHGTKDTIIPLAEGQKLYDGYAGPKSHVVIDGGQHTNLWGLGGREAVLEALGKVR